MQSLTKTEIRIVHFIALGFSEKEIAEMLYIEPSTVHTHSRNARRKTDSRNAVDLARKYILSLDDPKKILIGILFLFIELFNIVGFDTNDVRAYKSEKSVSKVSVRIRTIRKPKEYDTFIV